MLRLSIILGLISVLVTSAWADARVFALVVTSNRGTSVAQAPLAYADDDGVRYFSYFATRRSHPMTSSS